MPAQLGMFVLSNMAADLVTSAHFFYIRPLCSYGPSYDALLDWLELGLCSYGHCIVMARYT